MKTRSGFVSNSSSSSFVIPIKECDSVFDLAKTMIPAREMRSVDRELIRTIEDAEIKGMPSNTSICFTSSNYDTYIIKYKKYYLISTCNNISWPVYGCNFYPDDLEDLVDTYGDFGFESLSDIISTMSSFWYPEYGLEGEPIPYMDTLDSRKKCNHCCDQIRVIGLKKPVCLDCYKEQQVKKAKAKIKKNYASMSLKDKVAYVADKLVSVKSCLTPEEKKRIFSFLEEIKMNI